MFFLKSSNIHCFILFSLISIKSKTEGTDFFLRIFHIHCFILFSLICKKKQEALFFSQNIFIFFVLSHSDYMYKNKKQQELIFSKQIFISIDLFIQPFMYKNKNRRH